MGQRKNEIIFQKEKRMLGVPDGSSAFASDYGNGLHDRHWDEDDISAGTPGPKHGVL